MKCPACDGDGDARVQPGELRGGGGPVGRRMDVPCPCCGGSGLAHRIVTLEGDDKDKFLDGLRQASGMMPKDEALET